MVAKYTLRVIVVTLEPNDGDARVASPGLEKASWLYKERYGVTYKTSIVIDPTTARNHRKR